MPGMPVYPGDEPTKFRQTLYSERDGFNVHTVSMNTHAGTHIDAPFHAGHDFAAVDCADVLRACIGDALVIDVTRACVEREIMPSHLGRFREEIGDGDRVLLATGWSDRYGEAGYFEGYPSLSESLTDELVGRNIALIGLETPSPHIDRSEQIHKKFLAHGIVIVENLKGLARLGEGRVFFSAAPLSLHGLDGSPVRAYACLSQFRKRDQDDIPSQDVDEMSQHICNT